MTKKALRTAIGVSIGVVIGGTLIPRLTHPERYNDTYPAILVQALLYLVVSFAGGFLAALLIEFARERLKTED